MNNAKQGISKFVREKEINAFIENVPLRVDQPPLYEFRHQV
jgi:hypothetical protein